MNYTHTQEKLMEVMWQMDIVDAHEHLPPEHVRTSGPVDALTLFAHYTRTDLVTAGMQPEGYDRMLNPEIPLDERWQLIRPHLENIRYGSYARPAFLAAKEFYGFDDINDETYRPLSERMEAENTPGIYTRILRDKCNIRVALTQAGRTDYDGDLLVPLMPLDTYGMVSSAQDVEKRANQFGLSVKNLDGYLEVARKGVAQLKAEGAVGLKSVSRPNAAVNRQAAEEIFQNILKGQESGNTQPLRDFLMHEMFDIAADLDMVVAVHTGMWGDFRTLDPKHFIPIFPQHPRTKFDVYHMGMPWVRETGVIGKNFPNVWLNICWCHIISPRMTCSALDEYIDMVPINKIIGFGGDYGRPVEKVYGHLLMALEDIAEVLGSRVDRGLMGFDDAVMIAQKWLHGNPKELYQLEI